jgi:hypothetical protein
MDYLWEIFPIDFEVQRSLALDKEIEIPFSGSNTLPLTHTDTISHIYTTHGGMMFLIGFKVKRPKLKYTGHWSRNTIFGLEIVILLIQSHHTTHIHYQWKEYVPN